MMVWSQHYTIPWFVQVSTHSSGVRVPGRWLIDPVRSLGSLSLKHPMYSKSPLHNEEPSMIKQMHVYQKNQKGWSWHIHTKRVCWFWLNLWPKCHKLSQNQLGIKPTLLIKPYQGLFITWCMHLYALQLLFVQNLQSNFMIRSLYLPCIKLCGQAATRNTISILYVP